MTDHFRLKKLDLFLADHFGADHFSDFFSSVFRFFAADHFSDHFAEYFFSTEQQSF